MEEFVREQRRLGAMLDLAQRQLERVFCLAQRFPHRYNDSLYIKTMCAAVAYYEWAIARHYEERWAELVRTTGEG